MTSNEIKKIKEIKDVFINIRNICEDYIIRKNPYVPDTKYSIEAIKKEVENYYEITKN